MNKRIMNFETNNVLVAPFCISEWKNTQNKKNRKNFRKILLFLRNCRPEKFSTKIIDCRISELEMKRDERWCELAKK